jgi:glyoxylase-like metal-dependent hydrolase (beta-lactamase superfamily II)
VSTVRLSSSTGSQSPNVWGFYELDTGSCQYVCADPDTKKAGLIDVVWNFDPTNARTTTSAADQVLALVEREGLEVEWVLDTHPHADHLMASAYLKEQTGASAAIGEKVKEIAKLWEDYYNTPNVFNPEADFDRLFADGDTFKIGDLKARVMLSPGHTLGSITYVVGDAAFVHDTLMYPDSGSSRADLPGGAYEELWSSIQVILALPEDTRLFIGHDYCNDGKRKPAWEATVAEHKKTNIHVKDGTAREDFIKTRKERDKTLALPDRMLAALQVNLRGGRLPPAGSDGGHYLKIPVNKF